MLKLGHLCCAAIASTVIGFAAPAAADAAVPQIPATPAPAGAAAPLIHACDNDFTGSQFYNSYLTCTNCITAGETLQGRYHWSDWDCSYNPSNGLWDLHYWS
jgi:hypothetical protein